MVEDQKLSSGTQKLESVKAAVERRLRKNRRHEREMDIKSVKEMKSVDYNYKPNFLVTRARSRQDDLAQNNWLCNSD